MRDPAPLTVRGDQCQERLGVPTVERLDRSPQLLNHNRIVNLTRGLRIQLGLFANRRRAISVTARTKSSAEAAVATVTDTRRSSATQRTTVARMAPAAYSPNSRDSSAVTSATTAASRRVGSVSKPVQWSQQKSRAA